MSKLNPVMIIIGLLVGVYGFGWFQFGVVPDATLMRSNPSTFFTGGLLGLLSGVAIPNFSGFFTKILQAIGLINSIKNLFPPELIADLTAMIKSGKIDIQKLLDTYNQVDVTALMQLVQQLLALLGKKAIMQSKEIPATMLTAVPEDSIIIKF